MPFKILFEAFDWQDRNLFFLLLILHTSLFTHLFHCPGKQYKLGGLRASLDTMVAFR